MGGGEVIKKGWLIKSPPLEGGGIKAWRKRFFKLRSSKVLEYYKSDDGELLKGVINLEDCKSVHSDLAHKKYKYIFGIETKDRTYYLVAQTQEEMKEWVDELCRVCGLSIQDIPNPLEPPPSLATVDSTATSGPLISSPLYSTTPVRPGGVAFNERFKPSEEASLESMYSLACSVETEVQRQLSNKQEVPPGTPLLEALATKGISSAQTSSISSINGGGISTDEVFDSPPRLSPHHEETTPMEGQNLYTPSPKKSGGVVKPVPKPRSTSINPASSKEVMEIECMKPQRIGRTLNYDHLTPVPSAIPQSPAKEPSNQHRSVLLKGGIPHSNIHDVDNGDLPPVVNRKNKPADPSPPKVDRKLKPKDQLEENHNLLLPPSYPTRTSSLHSTSSPSENGDFPPVFPTRSSSLAITENRSQICIQSNSPDESPPEFPIRTTSLATTHEVSTLSHEEHPFCESDLPRHSVRTMQYTQIQFDSTHGNPLMVEDSKTPSANGGKATPFDVNKRLPIPVPRTGIRRVNYSDIDLAASKALSDDYKMRKQQVTLMEAERNALKDKPYVNVDRMGQVDDESDPDYYTHMRNLTYDEALAVLNTNIDTSDDDDDEFPDEVSVNMI